jgi:hypothetical protein
MSKEPLGHLGLVRDVGKPFSKSSGMERCFLEVFGRRHWRANEGEGEGMVEIKVQVKGERKRNHPQIYSN